MILFKILQEFLVPSVFTLVLLVVGSVLLLKSKKIGKIFLVSGIALYYLFSITPLADLTLLPLESQYMQIEENELGKTDKIVLLLGGREGDVLRASEVLRLYFLKEGLPQIIISGTDPLNPQKKEAEDVKEFLTERGIPAENIVLEDKSRNTAESAKNIKELLGKEPLFLVTSAYHLPRSVETFEKAGLNPVPAPADFKVEGQYNILDFFPDAKNLRNSDLAFHEYFGIIYYRLSL